MKNWHKYTIGVAVPILGCLIAKTFQYSRDNTMHVCLRFKPGSKEERHFVRLYHDYQYAFKRLNVYVGDTSLYANKQNAYYFNIKPRDLHLIEGFIVEF